jgi:hypothetical protein
LMLFPSFPPFRPLENPAVDPLEVVAYPLLRIS